MNPGCCHCVALGQRFGRFWRRVREEWHQAAGLDRREDGPGLDPRQLLDDHVDGREERRPERRRIHVREARELLGGDARHLLRGVGLAHRASVGAGASWLRPLLPAARSGAEPRSRSRAGDLVGARGFEPPTTSPPGLPGASVSVRGRWMYARTAHPFGSRVRGRAPLLLPALLPAVTLMPTLGQVGRGEVRNRVIGPPGRRSPGRPAGAGFERERRPGLGPKGS